MSGPAAYATRKTMWTSPPGGPADETTRGKGVLERFEPAGRDQQVDFVDRAARFTRIPQQAGVDVFPFEQVENGTEGLQVARRSQAPEPLNTDLTVHQMIFRSSPNDMFWMYWMSSRRRSSNVLELRPNTCQSPVMPGLTSRRYVCQRS